MRKILFVIFISVLLVIIPSCQNDIKDIENNNHKNAKNDYHEDTEMYNVIVVDNYKFLKESLNDKYQTDDIIVVKTTILMDVDLKLYVNDVFHSTQSHPVNTRDHWEYYITMPDHDITISFEVDSQTELTSLKLISYTFSSTDYNYEDVYQVSNDLNDYQSYLEETYDITPETFYYVIDTLEIYKVLYKIYSGEDLPSNVDFTNYKWILVNRVASSSSFIKADYHVYDEYIKAIYPFNDKEGDTALYDCYDFIRVPFNLYNLLDDLGLEIFVNER